MKKFIIPDTEDKKEKQEKLNAVGRLVEKLEKKSFREELGLFDRYEGYDFDLLFCEFVDDYITPIVFSILGEEFNDNWNPPGQTFENEFIENGVLSAAMINCKTKKYFTYIIKRREKGSRDFDLYLATCEKIDNKYKVRYFSSLSKLFAHKSSNYHSKIFYFRDVLNDKDAKGFGFHSYGAEELQWRFEIHKDFLKHF